MFKRNSSYRACLPCYLYSVQPFEGLSNTMKQTKTFHDKEEQSNEGINCINGFVNEYYENAFVHDEPSNLL